MVGALMPLAVRGWVGTLLWIVAVFALIWGVMLIFRKALWFGLALIVLALVVGPGNWFLFD
jgi:hypothetical protein